MKPEKNDPTPYIAPLHENVISPLNTNIISSESAPNLQPPTIAETFKSQQTTQPQPTPTPSVSTDVEISINYSAFTDRNVTAPKIKIWKYVATTCFFAGIVLVFAPTVLGSYAPNFLRDLTWGAPILWLVAIVGALNISDSDVKRQKVNVQRFLSDNNWQAVPNAGLADAPSTFLSRGGSHTVSSEITNKYRNRDFHLLEYTDSTKVSEIGNVDDSLSPNSTVVYTGYTILSFRLEKIFPYVTLEKGVGIFGPTGNWPGFTSLKLEGNFNEYFNVGVFRGQEQSALQLLSPDFMQELLQSPSEVGIEFSGKGVYFIVRELGLTAEKIQALFKAADIVLRHLDQISYSWQASTTPAELSELETKINLLRNK